MRSTPASTIDCLREGSPSPSNGREPGAPGSVEAGGGALSWGHLPLGAVLPEAPPLFPRADVAAWFAEHAPPAAAPPTPPATAKVPAKEIPVSENSPVVPPAPPEVPGQSAPASGTVTAPPAPAPQAERISYDDFLKVDLRVGEVLAAEKVEKSKKLMKMSVRIGEEVRTIVAGIATAYAPEALVGRKLVFVANLAPAKLMGVESNGMVLAASLPGSGEPSLLAVDVTVPSGTKVK